MGLPVSGSRQAWQHDRLLFLANQERTSRETFLGQGAEQREAMGEARGH